VSSEIPINPEAWVSSMTAGVDDAGDVVFTVHPSQRAPAATSDGGGLLLLVVGYIVGDELGWW